MRFRLSVNPVLSSLMDLTGKHGQYGAVCSQERRGPTIGQSGGVNKVESVGFHQAAHLVGGQARARPGGRGPGELTHDYKELLHEGVEGIIEHIERKKSEYSLSKSNRFPRIVCLEAMRTAAEGVIILGARHREEASRLAAEEKGGKRRRELEEIAKVWPVFRPNRPVPSMRLSSSSIFAAPPSSWNGTRPALINSAVL